MMPDGYSLDPNQHFEDPYHWSVLRRAWEPKQDVFVGKDSHGNVVKQYGEGLFHLCEVA